MAMKFILQDQPTLREAYKARKEEYEALRTMGKWSGAIMHAGILLELALKLVICKHLGETMLPTLFQTHELELLLYCSGLNHEFNNNPMLLHNFKSVLKRWSIDLRYQGATRTKADADLVDNALFDPANGILTFLTKHF